MKKNIWFALTVATVLLFRGGPTIFAQVLDDKEKSDLVKALRDTKEIKVSLERALQVSERVGIPISGGFEAADGKLDLWVFVVKGDKFLEVTVNYKTGIVDDVEVITGRGDLTDAKKQREAMAKAKISLRVVTEKAVKENSGYRAVNVTPTLKDGRPVATVTLLRGEEFKEVTIPLDHEESGLLQEDNKDSTTVQNSEWDPWEPFNEKVFWFNRQIDRFLLKPVAKAYDVVLPSVVKIVISNALDNLNVTRRLVNNILQLKIRGTTREISRFVINSSIGVAGLFDVAEDWFDIEQSDKDTGQTLGIYGIGSGPYLILPFLPPLTVRDFFGFVADGAMYPLDYFIPLGASLGIHSTEIISERAENLDKFQGVEETTVDLYGSVRNAYFQSRQAAIREGLGD